MDSKQRGYTTPQLIAVVVVLGALGGWIANIVKLIHLVGLEQLVTGMGIARVVGVFVAPLGSVLGFL